MPRTQYCLLLPFTWLSDWLIAWDLRAGPLDYRQKILSQGLKSMLLTIDCLLRNCSLNWFCSLSTDVAGAAKPTAASPLPPQASCPRLFFSNPERNHAWFASPLHSELWLFPATILWLSMGSPGNQAGFQQRKTDNCKNDGIIPASPTSMTMEKKERNIKTLQHEQKQFYQAYYKLYTIWCTQLIAPTSVLQSAFEKQFELWGSHSFRNLSAFNWWKTLEKFRIVHERLWVWVSDCLDIPAWIGAKALCWTGEWMSFCHSSSKLHRLLQQLVEEDRFGYCLPHTKKNLLGLGYKKI